MNGTTGKIFVYYRKYIWLIFFISLFLSACGYRFVGSGNLPAGTQRVFVEVLGNRTVETGLENIITNDLIYEFTRNRHSVQANREKAGAILTGMIESARIRTITRQGQQTPLERRIDVTVNLKLTDSHGKVIWSASGVSDSEIYNVNTDKQDAEQNKDAALKILSKRLAEKVYNSLTDDF